MKDLTEEQQAVYDRQLRVWGMEAQRHMNSTRLLISGLGGLGAETAKNLCLAGVGHITVLDDRDFHGDPQGNFLVAAATPHGTPVATATAAALQEMNPFIEVKGEKGRLGDAGRGQEYVARFDLVIAIGYGLKDAIQIDAWCAQGPQGHIKFFYARSRGPACFMFANMGPEHKWVPPKTESAPHPPERSSPYCSLQRALLDRESETGLGVNKRKPATLGFVVKACAEAEVRSGLPLSPALLDECRKELEELTKRIPTAASVPPVMLESWATQAFEYAPVSAVCGGLLGQEVVRAITHQNQVFQNALFYSLTDGHAKVLCLGVKKTEV